MIKSIHAEEKFNQHHYNIFRDHVFRYHSAFQNLLKEQKEFEINQQLIHFHYLFDWGLRWKFNEQFAKQWIEIVEKDPKFKDYKLKIQLHTKHCFP